MTNQSIEMNVRTNQVWMRRASLSAPCDSAEGRGGRLAWRPHSVKRTLCAPDIGLAQCVREHEASEFETTPIVMSR